MADTLTAERLPKPLRFLALVLSSLALRTILYTITSGITGAELAAVSRDNSSGWQIGGMLAFKTAEIAIPWYAAYDHFDLACLTLLNQVPHYYLLNNFYGVNILAAFIPLAVDITSVCLPFWALRRPNQAHRDAVAKTANQQVAQDKGVQWVTALLGAAVYAIVVYGSFQTWLPIHMVLHFDGVRSLERIHSTGWPVLFALFGPVGYAATHFIFVPAIGSTKNLGITDPKIAPGAAVFHPDTASFAQTIAHNVGLPGGLTPRAEIIAKRTALLVAYTFFVAFARPYAALEGTELLGCLGWATVWATAAGLTGVAYAWVGNE